MLETMSVLHNICGNNIPESTGVLNSRWSHDPLLYGAFANRSHALDDDSMGDLREPLDRLYFVGDYSDQDGYVNGAYLSAEEQTRNMLNSVRGNCERRYK